MLFFLISINLMINAEFGISVSDDKENVHHSLSAALSRILVLDRWQRLLDSQSEITDIRCLSSQPISRHYYIYDRLVARHGLG